MSINVSVVQSSALKSYFKYLSQIFAIITAFVLPVSTAALEVFFVASVIFSLLAGKWGEKYQILRTNRMALMFVIFFALFIVGLSYTSASQAEAFHMLLKYSKFLLGFFLFSVFIEDKIAFYAVCAFLLAATVTLFLSFIKFFTGWDILHRFGSDSGIFKDHIFTGFLLAFTSYCYGLIAFTYKKWRLLAILLFLLTVYDVLFINVGRSGYIVFFSLFFLLAWQQFHWKGLSIVFLISIFLLGSTFFSANNFKASFFATQSEIQQYDKGKVDTSAGLRLNFYRNSLRLLQQHPWIGTGTGSFKQAYSEIANDHRADTNNPHNEYLNIGVQFGLLGIIILISLFYTHWHESFKLAPVRKYFAQSILVSIAVGSLFNSWLLDVTQGGFYVFFTALVFSSLSKRVSSIAR
ncbi:MAG: O-antigen ligase family protein [Pseudomonadota bacterium]